MCIACHYQGDNRLVFRERRAEAHGDGDYRCVRDGRCIDCGTTLEPGVDHMCAHVEMAQVFGSRVNPGERMRS
jgi:hypothetical protein